MVDAMVEDGGFEGDVFVARHFVELKARSLLLTKWRAVEALAAALRKSKRLTGAEVEEICRREGVRRLGELSRDEAMARMTPQGRRAILGKVSTRRKDGRDTLSPHCAPSVWPRLTSR